MSRKVRVGVREIKNMFSEIIDCFLSIANYHFFFYKYIEKFKNNSSYTNLIPTQVKNNYFA